jgi:hypothetical protein
MKKFINHVDHVAWICRYENVEEHVARLETLSGVTLQRFERTEYGLYICANWESGLELLSPLPERTAFNGPLYDHLDAHGEGVYAVVFGVPDLEKHKDYLAAKGIEAGPEVDDHVDSPWHHKMVLRERHAGMFMSSCFVLGQIDYGDDVVRFEPVK